jgi:UDP-N-acetyl-D-glucosamine dehydrogenase
VIGLGYVGLPLAVEAARAGYKIRAVENNPQRCQQVNEGRNYISDVRSADLHQFVSSGSLQAFVNFDPISAAERG